MNLSELDDMLAFILNANDTQSATETNAARRKLALNSALTREWNRIQQHVSRAVKVRTHEFTWPAGSQTLSIPAELQGKTAYDFYDVTTSTTQPPRLVIRYRDATTLEWYDSGPGATKTIRAEYVAMPQPLVNPTDTPDLLLPQYHELLPWSAAIWITEILDREVAPRVWTERRNELFEDACKGMANRPQGQPTTYEAAYEDGGDYLP